MARSLPVNSSENNGTMELRPQISLVFLHRPLRAVTAGRDSARRVQHGISSLLTYRPHQSGCLEKTEKSVLFLQQSRKLPLRLADQQRHRISGQQRAEGQVLRFRHSDVFTVENVGVAG